MVVGAGGVGSASPSSAGGKALGFPLAAGACFSVDFPCCAGEVGFAFPGAAGGEALGFPLEVPEV